MPLDRAKVDNSMLIQGWIEDCVVDFKRLYPGLSEKVIRQTLADVAASHGHDVRAVICNDYEDDQMLYCTLLAVYDWIQKKKPILAGNGTFFKDQDKVSSPIANVILGRIAARKAFQKERDTWDQDSYEYAYFDMMQKEAKIKINSIYGSFGTTSFQLYNYYTAAATTGTAQSLISATAISFEAFLSDNAKFKSIDEFVTFFRNITNRDTYTFSYLEFPVIKDRQKVFDRYWNHFFTEDLKTDTAYEIMHKLIWSCNEEELTRLWYKNNLYAFMSTPTMMRLLRGVFAKTEAFRNPNAVPDNIQAEMDLIWAYTNDFVFYNHAYTERINRLVHDRRKSVIVIDTDSNMINIEPWVDFLKDNVWTQSGSTMDEDNLTYASVNCIAFLVTHMVRSLLAKYCKDCNVLDRMAPRINMKNEFYYAKMLLANVKKRYAALTKLQEGKEIKVGSKKELDVKGYDFRKAGVNEEISAKLFDILLTCIMRPDEVSVSRILSKLDFIEKDIIQSLKQGKRTYLLRMNCKVAAAYSKPESMGAYLAPLLWNAVYPENEIMIPDKLDVVILRGVKEPEILALKDKYPDEVERIERYIFHGPLGERFRAKGLVYLALPNTGDDIPEMWWEFIDINKTVARNLGTFEPVMAALNIPMITSGKEYKYFGNILDI